MVPSQSSEPSMRNILIVRSTPALIVISAVLGFSASAQTSPGGEWDLEVEWPQGTVSVLLTVQIADSLAVTGQTGEEQRRDR